MTTIADFLVSLGFRVDDASRAKAEGSYAAYEKAVRDAEARVEKARAAGAKAAIQIAAQKELAAAREALAAAKGADKTEDAEKRKAKAVKDAAKEIERAERERTRSQAQSTAVAIAKVEAFVGAVEAMARGAVTAITSVVQSFDNLYYASGRTGTSVRDLRGIAYAFSQVGGTAQQGYAAIESFTAALRNNPGLQGFVKGLGVDDKLGGVDKLLATVEALNKQPYYIGVQQAGMLGISEENYNLLTRQVEGIKKYRAEYKTTAQQIGLNEEDAAKASQRLSQAFGSLSVIIETSFTKLLTDQFPRISGWMESLGTWIKTHEPEIGAFFKTLAEKIEAFGTKADGAFKAFMVGLEDGSIKKGLTEFSERIDRLATGIERVVKAAETFLGLSDKFADLGFGPIVSRILGINAVLGAGPVSGVLGAGAVGTYNPLEAGPTGAAAPRPRVPDNRTWRERWLPTAWGGKPDPNAPAGEQRGGMFKRATRAKAGADGIPYEAKSLTEGVGITGKQYDAYREGLTDIEGKSYTQTGGSGGRYSGRYQFGPNEIRQTAIKLGEAPPSREQFLNDPKMQERFMERYTLDHHNYLMRRSPEYRGMSPEKKLEILGYAHNQGEGGAAKYLRTGQAGSDGFGTSGTAYFNPIRRRLGQLSAEDRTPTAPTPTAPKVDITVKSPPLPQTARPIKLPDYMNGPGGFDVNGLTSPGAPLGANSSPVNNTDASRSVTINQNNTNNVKVEGSNDPQTHGRVMEGALGRVHQSVLENTQSVVRG